MKVKLHAKPVFIISIIRCFSRCFASFHGILAILMVLGLVFFYSVHPACLNSKEFVISAGVRVEYCFAIISFVLIIHIHTGIHSHAIRVIKHIVKRTVVKSVGSICTSDRKTYGGESKAVCEWKIKATQWRNQGGCQEKMCSFEQATTNCNFSSLNNPIKNVFEDQNR